MMKPLYIFIALFLFGCQGMPSKKTPIHLNPNMDNQERYDAQEKQYFYSSNEVAKRNPIKGTIPYGYYKEDNPEFFYGKNTKEKFIDKVSDIMNVDQALLNRGQERFNIYCSACHGYTGEGNGLVSQMDEYNVIVTSLYSKLLDDKTDGYFFDVITNGKNNMPGYAHQISPEDRWAIVTYINALRFSRSNDNE